jgi:hypothetical protein
VSPDYGLAAKTELSDDLAISLDVSILEVIEEATTSTNHHQQTTTAMMVAFVKAKMLGQVVDAFGQQGNLYLGRPGVAFVMTEFGDDLFGGLHTR